MTAELNSKHFIDVGGRQVEVPLKIVLIRQVIKLASKGHQKALDWTLEMMALVQQSEAKRHASEKTYPTISRDELNKLSLEELHSLYDQAVKRDFGPDKGQI